jgi:hypothetical protein
MKFFSHPIVAFLLGFGGEVVIAVAVQRSSDMLDGILRYGSELYWGVPDTQTEVAPPIVPCPAIEEAPIAGPSVPPVAERTISTPVLLLGGAVTLSTSVIGVAYVVLYRRSRELQQRLTQLEAANTALMQHAAELQVANTIAVVKHATLAESVTELQTMNAAAAAEHDTRVQLENSLYELFGSLRASYSSARKAAGRAAFPRRSAVHVGQFAGVGEGLTRARPQVGCRRAGPFRRCLSIIIYHQRVPTRDSHFVVLEAGQRSAWRPSALVSIRQLAFLREVPSTVHVPRQLTWKSSESSFCFSLSLDVKQLGMTIFTTRYGFLRLHRSAPLG